MGGLFSVNVTFTILAVALPRIANDFGTTRNTMTWVITGPLLAFGVAAPTLGKAADQYGAKKRVPTRPDPVVLRRRALGAGLGRAPADRRSARSASLEGAATGAASMAIVMRTFDRDERVKAMGWWSLVGAGGPVIGVVLGGFLLESFGWRLIFAAQMPLIAAAFVLGSIVLPETETLPPQKFDIAGALTLSGGITALLFAINRGPETRLGQRRGRSCRSRSARCCCGWFVRVERRSEAPLLSLDYLKNRAFAFPVASQSAGQLRVHGRLHPHARRCCKPRTTTRTRRSVCS